MSEKSSTLVNINPADIDSNRDNPRGLFDEEDLNYLQQSIAEVGVLVPLIVYKNDNKGRKYVLLDGERRLRCARNLNRDFVPANIIDAPDRLHNILLMFNIHNVRKDWELAPTALKLELVMRLLPDSESASNTKIAKITGMSSVRVAECRRILGFNKRYIDMALEPDPAKRIRGDFFSQLSLALDKLDEFPEVTRVYDRDQITDLMIKKYREGTIVNIINEFRMLKKILMSPKKGAEKEIVAKSVKTFLKSEQLKDAKGNITSKAMSIDDLFQKTSHATYAEEKILKKSGELAELLDAFDPKKAKKTGELTKALVELTACAKKILEKMR